MQPENTPDSVKQQKSAGLINGKERINFK